MSAVRHLSVQEVAHLRDRVARERLLLVHDADADRLAEAKRLKDEAGRAALAALHEAERRARQRGGRRHSKGTAARVPVAPPSRLHHDSEPRCVYCGAALAGGGAKRPRLACADHRALLAADPLYGGGSR